MCLRLIERMIKTPLPHVTLISSELFVGREGRVGALIGSSPAHALTTPTRLVTRAPLAAALMRLSEWQVVFILQQRHSRQLSHHSERTAYGLCDGWMTDDFLLKARQRVGECATSHFVRSPRAHIMFIHTSRKRMFSRFPSSSSPSSPSFSSSSSHT
jgi:hypothetical protein